MILQISISIDMEFKTMKIIITESQLKNKVRQMVKTKGWEDTCLILGLNPQELTELFFNNDPMEFLNLFNDLEVAQCKEYPNLTLFRYEPKRNMVIYNKRYKNVYIDFEKIWRFLAEGFDLDYDEIQEITQWWLDEAYNLRGLITTKDGVSIIVSWMEGVI